jgi:peroxiredoxin
MPKAILVIAMAWLLVTGLMTAAGCGGDPDLTSGMGLVIDCDQNTGEEPEAGDASIDFRFEDAAGDAFALSDFRGRVVVLNFWATQCSYCLEELPLIQQLYDDWPETEVALLTIAKGQEPSTVADFVQAEGITFPVIVDRLKLVSSQYQVTAIPRTFFIDSEGYIMGIKRGYFQSYEEIEDIMDQIFSD